MTTTNLTVDELVPTSRLESMIGPSDATPSEIHDMAVELILRRRAKPAEVSEPSDAQVALHELQADMAYLFGRVAADSSAAAAMTQSVRAKLAIIEASLTAAAIVPSDDRAALTPPTPAVSSEPTEGMVEAARAAFWKPGNLPFAGIGEYGYNERLLAALRAASLVPTDGWRDIATAPAACHFYATYWSEYDAEWIVGIVMKHDAQPWTHWRHLYPAPTPAKDA